jgi:replicative DNA helicase
MPKRKDISRPVDKNLERKFLGGLIHNGMDAWIEFSPFIREGDFSDQESQKIFKVCATLLDEGSELNSSIIASRCKSIGLSVSSDDLADRIEDMLIAPLSKRATEEAAKEIASLAFRRREIDTLREAAEYISDFNGGDISSMIAERDKIIAQNVDLAIQKNEPTNIAQLAYGFVENLGNDGGQYSVKTPWKTFNDSFYGLRPKDSYCLAGRPMHGKSGVLLSLAQQCANDIEENFIEGKKLPVLYLDTEMEEDEQMIRWAAMVADINPYLIESGDWRRNSECVEKIRTVLKDKSNTDNFYHLYTPRMSIMEIRSCIRRWIAKTCGKDNVGIIVFDYLKITGDELKGANNPRLEMGYKLDVLKDEIKENSNCVFLFGAQRNRYGEDDDSSLAESDYIQQLATWVGLVKKKSNEELGEQPRELFGTHSIIPIKFRKLGREGANFANPVKINKKWVSNWINLDFSNFRFPDKGDGREVRDHLELVKTNRTQDNHERIP